jgi:predicted transcriptional regulator
MDTNALIDATLVKNSAKLLSILSRQDNLNIFMFADGNNRGLEAKSSTLQKIGLSRRVYYTRLKQLINAGLIEKSDHVYRHTTLGNIIYKNHILGIMEHLKNTKQMKMVDTLKHANQFSEDEIANFVSKITSDYNSIETITSASSIKVESVWTFQDMVSAIVERVELCNKEILLASRYLNEIIINSILRKANSSRIDVKVLTDSTLVKQYFEVEDVTSKLKFDNDKNSTERINVVSNPWYPGRVDRKIAKIPFSMIMLDRKEIGIEIVNWNDPKNFYGVIFVKGDQTTSKIIQDLYYKIWDNASPSLEYDRVESEMLNHSDKNNNRSHKAIQ